MKNLSSSAGLAILVLSAATAFAQVSYHSPDDDLGFYFNGELGPSFIQNFESSRFGYAAQFSAQPGFRLGAEPGYNFFGTSALTLGAEFETGVIFNRLNSVTELGSTASSRGYFYQVPLLGNLVLKFHPNSFITPYIGVGAGGDVSVATIHEDFFRFKSQNSEIDPAAQGLAGVRFRINSQTEVGLSYKFLADFPNQGKYIGTHAVMATFTLKF